MFLNHFFFFLIPASIAKAAAVIPKGAKIFFGEGTATFIHGFELILKVVSILFLTVVFSFFSCVFVNFTFTLLYSTIYTNYRTFIMPLENCRVVSFDCSRIITLVFDTADFILPVKIIC